MVVTYVNAKKKYARLAECSALMVLSWEMMDAHCASANRK